MWALPPRRAVYQLYWEHTAGRVVGGILVRAHIVSGAIGCPSYLLQAARDELRLGRRATYPMYNRLVVNPQMGG